MSAKIPKIVSSLKPIRMWIDGKCFNIKKFKNELKGFPSHDHSLNVFPDDSIITNSAFPKDEEGNFYTCFELPKVYYQKLQTSTDFDIKVLSEKTETKILFPKCDQEGRFKIVGHTEEDLKKALIELYSIIGFIREKNIALQFATIPLLNKEIQSNFEKFKKDVLELEKIENIDESVFIKKEKLHLTINVFVLLDEREIQEAITALNDYKNHILLPLLEKTGPLKIHVKGVDCMNSNYKKVNVVYANAKILGETEESNLQKIADDMANYFYERGLLKKYEEHVKIHMTLMNSKFKKIPGNRNKKNRKRYTIDASRIMERYENYDFGTCDLNDIRIAHIFATPDKDGFYKTLSKVNLLPRAENRLGAESICEATKVPYIIGEIHTTQNCINPHLQEEEDSCKAIQNLSPEKIERKIED